MAQSVTVHFHVTIAIPREKRGGGAVIQLLVLWAATLEADLYSDAPVEI